MSNEDLKKYAYLHSIVRESTVNGPGKRTVVHFQGCTIGCKGCFNVHTWKHVTGQKTSVIDIVDQLKDKGDNVTFSGGEPLEQPQALFEILAGIKGEGLTVILFTGRDPDELREFKITDFLQMLGVDLVVAGPYDHALGDTNDLRGSSNQEFIFLSDRITEDQVRMREVEVIINEDGSASMSGFPTKALSLALQRESE